MTTSTSPATIYRYSVTSKRTPGRPRKLSFTSTLVTASSTLIRRNSIRYKKRQPKTSLRKTALPTICEDESEELEERLSRFYIKNPTMNTFLWLTRTKQMRRIVVGRRRDTYTSIHARQGSIGLGSR